MNDAPFRTLAQACHHGMVLTDHEFDVPLDHARPDAERLPLFARAVVDARPGGAGRPWLVYLQGGPGFGGPRPTTSTGWLKRALADYRVLLIDSRGNGRSGVILPQTLVRRGGVAEQAAYLKHFRADSIVADAEIVRRQLVGEREPWSVLGQSYGGFCAMTYLSTHPESLREVIITGGLPPLEAAPDDYYRETYQEVARKTRKFFARYPGDEQVCAQVLEHLHRCDVRMPTGERLSSRRFQQVGYLLGFDDGMERLHYLLEGAFCRGKSGDEISYVFLRNIENALPFQTNPVFAVFQELCYAQGAGPRWSAQRVLGEYPAAAWEPGKPPSFLGEMVFPWMYEEYPGLRPFREVADILAADDAWPRLYDASRLARNTVPCAAAIYSEDMYVPRAHSEASARRVGRMRAWLTNEYEHSGLGMGEHVLDRLLAMVKDLV